MKKKKENQANSETRPNVEKINQNSVIVLPDDAESKGDNNYGGENAKLIGTQDERNSKADGVY